ncbi:hypothetical protein SC171_27195 [Pantoea cypripedii]|uniref:hypothetical protein n=1 Tax=Pantoea cypripedii TaxID=55209 RepID=UPI002FC82E2B
MPIHFANSVTAITPPSSGENNQPKPVPLVVSNINIHPVSNAVQKDTQREPAQTAVRRVVTAETFVEHMNTRSETGSTPTTFLNIKFSPFATHDPRLYKGLLHFKEDTFIGVEFRNFNIGGKEKVKFHYCTFVTGDNELAWLKLDLTNTDWEGSTIDGLYNGSRTTLKVCYFTKVNMSHCKLKDFKINDSDTRLIYKATFDYSSMENLVFEGFRHLDEASYYKIEKSSFRNVNATNLTWDAVRCVKNVDLTNAKITNWSLLGGTELTHTEYGIYEKLTITINPAMFDDIRKIVPYLDSVNTLRIGALFLHTLDSIPHETVKQDFAEQLLRMIENVPALSVAYASLITLRQSIINQLSHADYATSPEIQSFIRGELLKEGNDILIPENLRPIMYSELCLLEDSELLSRQFIVNQLIAEYPALKERFYQITPIKEFITHLEGKTIANKDRIYHIFYNPNDRRTALYLPTAEYKKLIESKKEVPQNFSFLQYQPGGKNVIVDKPVTIERQSRVLSAFPALHSLWSRADGLFTPVINSLFENDITLDAIELSRALNIKNQMISMLKYNSYQRLELNLENDAPVLSEILFPFNVEGADGDNARWRLVELMQRELSPKISHFSDREQKTIAFMCLIKTLSNIFYTRYCTVKDKSPYAPRLLAHKLIEDLKAFAPEAISENEATFWSKLLLSNPKDELAKSIALSDRMKNHQISGEHGEEMTKIMQIYYPLS